MYLLRISGGKDEHGAIGRHGPGTSFTTLIIVIILILLCWKRLGVGIFINWTKTREQNLESDIAKCCRVCYRRRGRQQETQHLGSGLTLQYGINGWEYWHVQSCVVRVGQPNHTVRTVMSDVPIAT